MAQGLEASLAGMRIGENIPPASTNFARWADGLANIYTFDIKPGSKVFRYDVELMNMTRGKSLTMGAGDDGKKGLLSQICYELVNATFQDTNGFGSGGQAQFVYDNRKTLFTNMEVQQMSGQITPDRMTPAARTGLNNATVSFDLQPCRDQHGSAVVVDLSDLRSELQSAAHEQTKRSIRSFLELLTSQPFINANTHKIVGAGRLFERKEANRLNPAITTHRGLAKGVRIVKNGDVKPSLALVADVKTCAFFAEGSLEDIANQMIQQAVQQRRLNTNDRKQMDAFWIDFGQLFKGVSAQLTYAQSRVIVIDSITTRMCSEISFEVEGRPTTMVDFFRTQKNVNIDPNMPAVRQHVNRESLYPLKCLHVLPFQRLSLDKMSLNEQMANISKNLLTANAVGPAERYRNIETEMRNIGATNTESAKFMLLFGVKLKGGRNDVKIGMLELPKIQFGGNTVQRPNERGGFDVRGQMSYLEPSRQLKKWIIAAPRKINEGQYRKFVDDILRMARQRGMQIPQPGFDVVDMNQIDDRMKSYAAGHVEFVLYLDNKYVESHSLLKLSERKYKVLTQHVTIEMAQKAGPASVSNVLNKINMKLSGQNYFPILPPAANAKFNIASGEVLVIGLDTSKPPRATAFEKFKLREKGMDVDSEDPLAVGFCANYLKNPMKFCGDYFYQPCKQDVLDPDFLGPKMIWLFNQIKTARPGKIPHTIFIIRDGISEGMVPNAIKDEFSIFEQACLRFTQGKWKPNFVYCIVDKRHNKRFFVKSAGQNTGGNGVNVQNTMPGSVIDRKFVRIDMHEFFLQSHFPLKGTSKIPQYIVPINQVKATNEELQAFLLSLCNMWQIVNLPPALPSPVLQAKELAKRGRNNYVELKRSDPRAVPQTKNEKNAMVIDFGKLNGMLNYEGSGELVKTRFNA